MLALIYGKDRFRVMRRRTELKNAFRSDHPDGEIVSFDMISGVGSFQKFLAESIASDLFGSRRFLDVGNAFLSPDDVSEKTVKAISDTDFSSVDGVVSFAGVPKAKDPLYAIFKKKADIVEEWKPLSSAEAFSFIAAEAASVSEGVSISRKAAEKMIALCGTDSAKLASLTRTLATYRESGEVSAADLDLFVSDVPKEVVFAALDALVSGNRGKAVTMLLKEVREDSGGALKLFGLLAWQLRELIKIRGEYDNGNTNSSGIASACGMKPFVVGKLLSRISAFPFARLRAGLDLLTTLDRDMKRGRVDPELALTLFIQRF